MSPILSTKKSDPKVLIMFSLPLALLVSGVSLVGIFTRDFYVNETPNWQVQSLGQDMIDLVLIVPALMAAMLITLKNKTIGFPIWGGVLLYLVYTFVIYSFDVHFNKLFVLYCLILGVSFYAFTYFIYKQLHQKEILIIESTLTRRVIGIYFIVIAVLFYFLWLSEILPTIVSNQVPKILSDAGLPTNPVHVLDLAIVLPGIFLTGVLLIKNKALGLVFAPVVLVFFVLMDITIGTLNVMMQQQGLEGSLKLTMVMGVLALFSFTLLVWYVKRIKPDEDSAG